MVDNDYQKDFYALCGQLKGHDSDVSEQNILETVEVARGKYVDDMLGKLCNDKRNIVSIETMHDITKARVKYKKQ